MAKLRKLTTEKTWIYHEADMTADQLKRYKEGDEDAKYEVQEELEEQMEFMRDEPASDDVYYELIED